MKVFETIIYSFISLIILGLISFSVPCPTCDHIICEKYGPNILVDCSLDSIHIQTPADSIGKSIKMVTIKDTLLGLNQFELPLPEDWEILPNQWIAPGNTIIKEVSDEGVGNRINLTMDALVQNEIKPILYTMNLEITGSNDYYGIASHVFKATNIDSLYRTNGYQCNLEVKGLEFKDRFNKRGMVLLFLWTLRDDYMNFNNVSYYWMDGNDDYFEINKSDLIYGLSNIHIYNENQQLLGRVLNLKNRLSSHVYYRHDDFIYDEEVGKNVRWYEYEDKQNKKEKLELNKELIKKGVCPDKLNAIWQDSYFSYPIDTLDYDYSASDFEYDPDSTIEDDIYWQPRLKDSVEVFY